MRRDRLWTSHRRQAALAASSFRDPHRDAPPLAARHPLPSLPLDIRQQQQRPLSPLDRILAHHNFCDSRFGDISLLGRGGGAKDFLVALGGREGNQRAGEESVARMDVLCELSVDRDYRFQVRTSRCPPCLTLHNIARSIRTLYWPNSIFPFVLRNRNPDHTAIAADIS